jgi:hypothetical protein
MDQGPLRDALENLSERYNFSYIVDAVAFQNDLQIADVENQPVKLAKLAGVRLHKVLQMLVAQVQADVLVHDGIVEVLPATRLQGEEVLKRRVDAAFAGRPINQALQELADRSGANIVLDNRLEEKATTQVSADLQAVPVQTVVRVLADMAGLRAVVLDNLIYVTSEQNAAKLEKELAKQRALPEAL